MKNAKTYAILTILLWSSLATLGANLQRLPPFQITGAALLIGSLLSIYQWKDWKVPVTTALVGIGGIFGYHYLLFSALRTAPATEANLLNYLWPLLIVMLSPLFGEGKLKFRHIISAASGFCGAVLIVSAGKLQLPETLPQGYFFAILAALTWAIYSLTTKKLPSFPNAAIGGFCFMSGILALIAHCISEVTVIPTEKEWLILIAMGIGPLGAAFFLWNKAMQAGDPKQIGALSYLTPLLSTLLLALTGTGSLSTSSLIAGCLILAGALTGVLPEERSRKAP